MRSLDPRSSSNKAAEQREAVLGEDRLGVELEPAEVRSGDEVDVAGLRVGLDHHAVRAASVADAGDEGVVEPDPLLAPGDVDRRLGALEDDVLVGKGDPEPVAQHLVARGRPPGRACRDASRSSIARPVGRDLRVVVVARVAGAGADDDQVDVVEGARRRVVRRGGPSAIVMPSTREHVRQHVHEVVLAVEDRDVPARERRAGGARRPGR